MPEKKKAKAIEVKALVIQEIALTPRQTGLIMAETPKQFIKEKPGRGGKKVSYVEGGYIINQLNGIFSPLGWDFEIVEQGQTERKNESRAEGEVWVRGKLTINDHKHGFHMSKTQYGQHPIHEKVPIGDAFKAAATDAMKKCASMLGIAQDVYWGELDMASPAPAKGTEKPVLSKNEMFERAKAMLKAVRAIGVLIAYDEKLDESKTFTDTQKKELHALIKTRVSDLETK